MLAYDTEYAMVDRDDDLKIGIRTSAITLGRFDVAAVMLFYAVYLASWAAIGAALGLHWPYFRSCAACGGNGNVAWLADQRALMRRLLSRLSAESLAGIDTVHWRGRVDACSRLNEAADAAACRSVAAVNTDRADRPDQT